jgi:hypothetical protein
LFGVPTPAFNARDVEGAFATTHEDVDLPNLIEGTRLHGHNAVRDYWLRQFATIDRHVEPIHMTTMPDGRIAVEVHQMVRDKEGNLLADGMVQHVDTLRDGLIERMDARAL